MQTVKIAVCDDEPMDLQQTLKLTGDLLSAEGQPCELSAYESAPALLNAFQHGSEFDILLLDVQMEQMDGMELAAALRDQGSRTAIIFISVNREMALRGYEVAAVRYLAKPLKPARLREALLFCCRSMEQKALLLPTANGQRRILLSELVYAEASERVTVLSLVGRKETLSMKISSLEALLPERQFVLCHRSYLVNLAFVSALCRRELELTTGDRIPMSKYRAAEVRKRLLDYLN